MLQHICRFITFNIVLPDDYNYGFMVQRKILNENIQF